MTEDVNHKLVSDEEFAGKIVPLLKVELEKNCDRFDEANNCYIFNYTPYSDPDQEIIDGIVSEDNGLDEFWENNTDLFLEEEEGLVKSFMQDCVVDPEKRLPSEERLADIEDKVREYIHNNVLFEYDPLENRQVEAFAMVDYGDRNYEYCEPSRFYMSDPEEIAKLSDREILNDEGFKNAGITWLIKSQGYDPVKFARETCSETGYLGPSKFLTSLNEELNNAMRDLGSYAVCVSFKCQANDFLKLKCAKSSEEKLSKEFEPQSYKGNSSITLDKNNVTVGLFDPVNGGGSIFEVQLEKDLTIPLPMLDLHLDRGNFRDGVYTVSSVYGGSMSSENVGVKEIKLMSSEEIIKAEKMDFKRVDQVQSQGHGR